MEIVRVYRGNRGEIGDIIAGDLRTFEVWPDFRRNGWNGYYCFYPEIRDVRLSPFGYSRSIGKKIWNIPEFPEAILCRYKDKDAGIILLKSPQESSSKVPSWNVAIDLGTANTSIFYRQGADDPTTKPMEFKARCVQIIDAPEHSRELSVRKSFFPVQSYSEGIFSTSFIRNPLSGMDELEPVINGKAEIASPADWFYWIEGEEDFLVELEDDLKWSRDQRKRNHLSAYLKHLILMVSAEAASRGVTSITLKWSYPSAFSEDMKSALENAFTNLQQWIMGIQKAIKVTVAKQGETESIAVCRYLSERDKSMGPKVIADIGGGTIDICVWDNGNIKTQTSVSLASRIFIEYIGSQDGLRREIFLLLNKPHNGNSSCYFTVRPAHCFNNLIKEYHEALYPLFNDKKRREAGWKECRSIIFLIFSGIIYYIGMILKSIDFHSSAIQFAGNGSKLINLVDNNAISRLWGFLPDNIRDNIRIRPALAAHTKQEAARGLLSNTSFNTYVNPTIIIGEDGYKFGGRDVGFSQEITTADLTEEIEPPDNYPRLMDFLGRYNRCAEKLELESLEIPHDLNLQAEMKGKIGFLSYQQKDHPEQVEIQPFFIEELKLLIKIFFFK